TWDTDRTGPLDSAGAVAGAASGLGWEFLRAQLRVSARALRASGGGKRARVPARRPRLGGGRGLGEVLRPGKSRQADGSGETTRRRWAGAQADRALSEGRGDGRASVPGHDRRNAARRAAVTAACKFAARRTGSGTGTARPSLCALRGRLQHLR